MRHQRHSRSHTGFSIVELMVALAIVMVLGSVAVGAYTYYVMRGQLAQVLVDYGRIREVVALASRVDQQQELQQGSKVGEPPPALAASLGREQFNNAATHLRLQLVKAPAGTFASYPDRAVYALVASASDEQGALYLRVFRHLLPHGDGDKPWLSERELAFPLEPGGASGAAPPDPPPSGPGSGSGGWSHVETDRNGSTWTARAQICLHDINGQLLSGLNMEVEVQVTVTAINADGTPGASWVRVDRLKLVNGCATYEIPGLSWYATGGYGNPQVQFDVVNLWSYDGPPAVAWDGSRPSVTIHQP